MQCHLLEEWDNLWGKNFSSSESLRVEHHLSNELSVWLSHGKATVNNTKKWTKSQHEPVMQYYKYVYFMRVCQRIVASNTKKCRPFRGRAFTLQQRNINVHPDKHVSDQNCYKRLSCNKHIEVWLISCQPWWQHNIIRVTLLTVSPPGTVSTRTCILEAFVYLLSH